MIEKQGKLYINGKLQDKRFDKNEDFGVDMEAQSVKYFEIIKEFFLGRYKITISKSKELRHNEDFMTLAFDPQVKCNNCEILNAQNKELLFRIEKLRETMKEKINDKRD